MKSFPLLDMMAQGALVSNLDTSRLLGESDKSGSLTFSSDLAMQDQPINTNDTSINGSQSDGSMSAQEMGNDLDATTVVPNTAQTPKRAINLLDLPIEILEKVFEEVRNTHDLTCLARACSKLHSLAIPHMYSRFDIVWPEEDSTEDAGVDALSYGLATLVMGEDIFTYSPLGGSSSPCFRCGSHMPTLQPSATANREGRYFPALRRGNAYAQFTRHFSIGNGPNSWVMEYKTNKDTGKMLGTLVALAVARMINLETFTWDMPTGVVRDVWMALSSLADRPGHNCRLESVWVRWHDNSEHRDLLSSSSANTTAPSPPLLQGRYGHVEFPTFSLLPPLKSLSVLDIDEAAYLDELEVLIRRSRNKLRELRIGISRKAAEFHWARPLEENLNKPVPPNESVIKGWPKFGGVLSILLNDDDMEWYQSLLGFSNDGPTPTNQTANRSQNLLPALEQLSLGDILEANSQAPVNTQQPMNSTNADAGTSAEETGDFISTKTKPDKLRLETLELERVILLSSLLSRTLDWCCLTSLTILQSDGHERLWRGLRRQFSPDDGNNGNRRTKPTRSLKKGLGTEYEEPANQYTLKLKRLRTDRVSPYLMLFLKESLAPNSLEQFIIQEDDVYESVVPVEAIYYHIIKRQRASLKTLLVDASRRNVSGVNTHWRKWMFTREMLSFITSGRMPQLQELGMGIERDDWHFLLRRIPDLPRLKALYVHHIGDSRFVYEPGVRELALQVLDIVTLRPDVSLCYLGIGPKCYEIYEATSSEDIKHDPSAPPGDSITTEAVASSVDSNEVDETDEDPNEEIDEVSDAEAEAEAEVEAGAEGDSGSESEDLNESDSDGDDGNGDEFDNSSNSITYDDYSDEDGSTDTGYGGNKVQLDIREILFYDEKVTIFKARHGCL